jgi:hypothetical protein
MAHRIRGSDRAGVRAVQRVLAPLAVRFGADHLLRRRLEHVVNEGFDVECRQRSKWGIVERVVARKPHPESRAGR